ncbi:MAG: I78 family peptidase inhibitor [Pseudomonadota bacterium]
MKAVSVMVVFGVVWAAMAGGCARGRDPAITPPRFLGPPVSAPPGGAPADLTPGFVDKEPDTCKAAGLQGLIGQSAGNLRTVALTGPVRIIAPGELVTQEYVAQRINVAVDGAGTIRRIDCG